MENKVSKGKKGRRGRRKRGGNVHLSSVELVLGSLQKVSVTSTRLSRSRGDHGEDLSGGELLSEL